MTEQQIAALKALAEKATLGAWTSYYEGGGDHIIVFGDATDDHEIAVCSGPNSLSGGMGFDIASANASYIAAANPAAILELIGQLEAMRKNAKRYRFEQRRDYDEYVGHCPAHGLKPMPFDEYKVNHDKITDVRMALAALEVQP